MKFLFVTNLGSVYESYEALADQILGPILAETGWLIDYDAWTLDEMKRIAESGTSSRLNTALTKGVTLFGSPPYTSAD
jgi:hypothetical protein